LSEWALSVGFLMSLSLPLAGTVVRALRGTEVHAESHSRTAALSSEPLDPRLMAHQFERDFPMRRRLIRWHGIVKVRCLGASTSPWVVLGKNGWLFYAGPASNLGRWAEAPFTEAEL